MLILRALISTYQGAKRARGAFAVRIRRISQILSFAVVVLLLAHTKLNFLFKIDPLLALTNGLVGHVFYGGLGWALVILIPTFILGRFFCGWICPMGSLNHFLGSIGSKHKSRGARSKSNRYKNWQTTKFFLLIAGLVAALLGSSQIAWIDPISMLVRSIGLSILPAAASKKYFVVYVPHYWLGILLLLIFLSLLAMNRWVTRFWCRAMCPLGALLGVAARWSILGLHKDASTCNNCNGCQVECQGGDDPIGGAKWHKAECHLCLNCVAACPHESLQFRFFYDELEVVGTSLKRRSALAAVAAGLAAVPLLHAETALGKSRKERLIRPPGALDESDFLSRCIRCGECMRVCPNHALQPAFTEAGIGGLWSPVLTPNIGYCEPGCVLCSEVCPTGAIMQLSSRRKGWVVDTGAQSAPVRVGTAFYERGHCLPWAMATDCSVCLEWCPVSPKAIYVESAEVTDADGKKRMLKQPHIDTGRCVGCGACEFACPIQERPAVYVTSKGESRPARR